MNATPWDALLHLREPVRMQLAAMPPESRPSTKTASLLAELHARGSASTHTLCVCADLTPRQVWGLLKQPRAIGQVRFHAGRWSLVQGFAGRDIERAAALLRSHGWLVEPPAP